MTTNPKKKKAEITTGTLIKQNTKVKRLETLRINVHIGSSIRHLSTK